MLTTRPFRWLTPGLQFGLLTLAAFGMAFGMASAAVAEDEPPADPLAGLTWRGIGPVNMSGRVADVESIPGDPRTVYVGAGSGGVWRSRDAGATFEPIFDDQGMQSIGDMALAPSNPAVIYVGTGEANVRNSVSFGNGVYRSTDGGDSWSHVGLEKTRHIPRIVVDPSDPDTVFVGALGSIYAPSENRGVFRSRDGGATWDKVLYLDEDHGVADLDIDPTNPKVLFAAMWHFRRQPWTFTSGSEDGGVWRSIDGGDTWNKLEDGLPKLMGRVAVKVAASNPEVVYVLAETNEGTLFRSDDRGTTFRKISDNVDIISRGFYYTDLRVDPTDENRIFAVSSRLFRSVDGGKSFERMARSVHIDFHSLWIDPTDPERMWVGEDGGIAVSYDRGDTWDVPRNLPIGQFYQVFVGNDAPFYTVGGGLQDNGTWYGPSRTREPAGILEDDWRMMSFGDAYFTLQHPTEPDVFISESQAGGILRTDMRTRQQLDISPQPERNDGGPAEELEYRFNWNSPIVRSPHDDMKVYFAGNVVFESPDFGDTWRKISPDLTTNDPAKLGQAGGPVWPENTTAEYHCTIISFAESPVEAGVLWVGTDDGNLQLSRDGGETWSDLTGNLAGVPAHSPVSHVEPSATQAGTAYAAFDRHMFDDYRAHVYRTNDFGVTWSRITDGLPEEGWVWVVREDPKEPDVLYAGTEVGLYASWDRGSNWHAVSRDNLPPASVHDVLVHPTENDLIVGTHGRAIWILDDATPIQQLATAREGDTGSHLFTVRPGLRFPTMFTRYGIGDTVYRAPNPPKGALISYYLAEDLTPAPADASDEATPEEEATAEASTSVDEGADEGERPDAIQPDDRIALEILDTDGNVVRALDKLPMTAGVQRVAWDLTDEPPVQRNDEPSPFAEFFGGPSGTAVLPGRYTARLTVDGQVSETPVEVRVDPTLPVATGALEAQQALATTLRALQSAGNQGLRALDRLLEQLSARRDTHQRMRGQDAEGDDPVKPLFEELEKAINEQLHVWVREDGKPFWSQGPHLIDHISGLARSVDGQFSAPTAAQQAYAERLRGRFDEAIGGINALLTKVVPSMNDKLAEHGVPALALPGAITVE